MKTQSNADRVVNLNKILQIKSIFLKVDNPIAYLNSVNACFTKKTKYLLHLYRTSLKKLQWESSQAKQF